MCVVHGYERLIAGLHVGSCWRLTSRLISAAANRRGSSAVLGVSTGTVAGLPSSSTAIMVKKQLLTWRTTLSLMSSAMTLMPISIEELPVWFTEARKVTSSPTLIGWRNIT